MVFLELEFIHVQCMSITAIAYKEMVFSSFRMKLLTSTCYKGTHKYLRKENVLLLAVWVNIITAGFPKSSLTFLHAFWTAAMV